MTRARGHGGAGWMRRGARRGSVYVLVLGFSTMVVVAGAGAVMLARAGVRQTTASRDWSEAGIAARSGVEYAVAWMNATSGWRSTATSGTAYGPLGIGRARVAVTIADASDGDLANDPTQSVRVYATATVGSVTRCYSAMAAPSSSAGYDVLRCAVHSDAGITVSNNVAVSAGPLSSNAGTTIGAGDVVTGDIETQTLSSSGSVIGYVQTGVAAKTMPGSTAWTTLSAGATPLTYNSNIDHQVLTAGVNTIGGGLNAGGVYSLSVPLGTTCTIHRSRFQATLLVTLGASASLVVRDEMLWDPAQSGQPTLLVQGGLLSSVTLSGSANALAESAGSNYNPAGAPYNGVTDADTTDSYPNEIHGLVHVISNIPVTLGNNLTLIGSVVSAGAVKVLDKNVLTAQPSLKTNPPQGYYDPAGGKMAIVPGSWRWEVQDVHASVTP